MGHVEALGPGLWTLNETEAQCQCEYAHTQGLPVKMEIHLHSVSLNQLYNV